MFRDFFTFNAQKEHVMTSTSAKAHLVTKTLNAKTPVEALSVHVMMGTVVTVMNVPKLMNVLSALMSVHLMQTVLILWVLIPVHVKTVLKATGKPVLISMSVTKLPVHRVLTVLILSVHTPVFADKVTKAMVKIASTWTNV